MIGKMKAFGAGVLLGLLVAPRSGRESLRRLAELVDRFFETGSEELDQLEAELAAADGGRRDPDAGLDDEEPWETPEEDLGE